MMPRGCLYTVPKGTTKGFISGIRKTGDIADT